MDEIIDTISIASLERQMKLHIDKKVLKLFSEDESAMTSEEFLKEVLKRENKDWAGMRWRFEPVVMMRLGHGICGVCNEAGELMEHWKKAVFMGTGLASHDVELRHKTKLQILEELGDLMYFVTLVMDSIGVSLEEVYAANVAKLTRRYGDEFSAEKCEKRDTKAELDEIRKTVETSKEKGKKGA